MRFLSLIPICLLVFSFDAKKDTLFPLRKRITKLEVIENGTYPPWVKGQDCFIKTSKKVYTFGGKQYFKIEICNAHVFVSALQRLFIRREKNLFFIYHPSYENFGAIEQKLFDFSLSEGTCWKTNDGLEEMEICVAKRYLDERSSKQLVSFKIKYPNNVSDFPTIEEILVNADYGITQITFADGRYLYSVTDHVFFRLGI